MKSKIYAILCAGALVLTTGCYRDELANFQKQIDDFKTTSLDALDKKIKTLDEQIASIEATIKQLEALKDNLQGQLDAANKAIADLTDKMNQGDEKLEGEISILKESVAQLTEQIGRIDTQISELKTYIDEELRKQQEAFDSKLADQDSKIRSWVEGTYATIAKMNEVSELVATIQTAISTIQGVLERHDELLASYGLEISAIKDQLVELGKLEDSLKSWVNEQLSDYYTIAQIEAKLDELKNGYSQADDLLRQNIAADLEEMKEQITEEYLKAIRVAIEQGGVITEEIQRQIDALKQELEPRFIAIENRLDGLEASIAQLERRVQTLEEQQKEMQKTLNNLEYAYRQVSDAVDRINITIDELKNTTIPGMQGQIDDLLSRVAELERFKTEIETRIGQLEQAIAGIGDVIDGKINDYDALIKAWVEESLKNFYTKTEIQELLQNLETTLRGAISDAVAAEEAARIAADTALETKLQAQIDDLKTRVAELEKIETAIKDWVIENYYNKSDIDTLLNNLTAAFEDADKDLKDYIDGIVATIRGEMSDQYDKITGEYEAAIQKAIEDFQGTFSAEIEGKLSALKSELEGKISDISTALNILTQRVDVIEGNITTLQGIDEQLRGLIEDLQAEVGTRPDGEQGTLWSCIAALQAQDEQINSIIDAIKNFLGDFEGKSLDDIIDGINTTIDGLATKDELNNLESDLKAIIGAGLDGQTLTEAIEQLQEDLDKLDQRLSDIEDRLDAIEKILNSIRNNLKSMVVIPDYEDGSVKVEFGYGDSGIVKPESFSIQYKVSPTNYADSIAKVEGSLQASIVNTQTKAGALSKIDVLGCTASAGILTVSFDSKGLPEKFFGFDGDYQPASLALSIVEEGEEIYTAGFAALYPSCSKEQKISVKQTAGVSGDFTWREGYDLGILGDFIPGLANIVNYKTLQVTTTGSPGKWSIKSYPDWLRIEEGGFTSGSTLKVYPNSVNNSLQAREGVILFKSATGALFEFAVKQAAAPYKIELSKYNFPKAGGTADIIITQKPNNWNGSNNDNSWIEIDNGKPTKIVVKENNDMNERVGMITITIGNEKFNVSITQEGADFKLEANSVSIGNTAGSTVELGATLFGDVKNLNFKDVPTWLETPVYSGGQITFKAKEGNTSDSVKKGTVTVYTTEDQQSKVEVSQNPQMQVSAESVAYDGSFTLSAPSRVTFDAGSNVTLYDDSRRWNIDIYSSSINFELQNDGKLQSRTIYVTNSSFADQTITFTCEGVTKKVTVTAKPPFTLGGNSISLKNNKNTNTGSVTISLAEGIKFTNDNLSTDADWLNVAYKKNLLSEDEITVSAGKNTTGSSRTAEVTVTYGDYSQTMTVTQNK